MKRRVQRAHNNKRVLRIVSATHKLSLDNYNVLVDASFLRATLMAFMTEEGQLMHEYLREQPPQAQQPPPQSQRFNAQVNPFAFMKDLVEESFGVTTHTHQEDYDGHLHRRRGFPSLRGRGRGGGRGPEDRSHPPSSSSASTASGAKRHKGTQLHFYYLPESAAALRRLIQHQQQEENNKKKFKTSKIEEAARYLLANLRRIHFAPDGAVSAAVSSPSTKRSKGGGHSSSSAAAAHAAPPPHRNEAKTIAAFLAFAAHPHLAEQQQQHQGEATTREGGDMASVNTFLLFKNAHHFFVATQSHDTRKRLPADAALVRFSAQSNCIYLEIRGQSYHYPEDNAVAPSLRIPSTQHSGATHTDMAGGHQRFTRSRGSGTHEAIRTAPSPSPRARRHGASATTIASSSSSPSRVSSATGLAAERGISAADVAFMRHLGMRESCIPAASPASASIVAKGSDGAQQPTGVGEESETAPPSQQQQQQRRGGKKRSRGANPNPLSNKKKQKREVFRID